MKNKSLNIVIFENEYLEIEGAFQYLNIKYFNDLIKYKVYPSSQSIEHIESLQGFDLIIIDIDLSSKSELDGFGLIKKIEFELDDIPEILILTGHEISLGYEKQYGINPYPFIEKPVNYLKLMKHFNLVIERRESV